MTNPYHGINAHLNSLLQTPGTASWTSFHQMHITFLVQQLNRVLPQNYRAVPEHSLQIKIDDAIRSRPRLDVTVFRRYAAEPAPAAAAQPAWKIELTADMALEELYPAAVIRHVDDLLHGKVITRIELLSPSNKPGGSAYRAYKLRRLEAIQSGTPLVEIDYLHETRSPIETAPVYPADDAAYPYTITVTDPRPDPAAGEIKGYAARVDELLPVVPVPLAGDETVNFNVDEVYQYTVGEDPWATIMGDGIDMTQPPARFDTYRPDDQQRIQAVMARYQVQ